MTSCARGCCWTPWQACAQQRACACHREDRKPAPTTGNTAGRHRDPTSNEAIRNVMRQQKGKR